jgi:inorganic pyrophosphatase
MLVPARLLGVLRVEQSNPMTQTRERNDRAFVVPAKAERQEHVRSVDDLSKRTRMELEQFFTAAVAFEGKRIALLGWGGPEEADAFVRAAVE